MYSKFFKISVFAVCLLALMGLFDRIFAQELLSGNAIYDGSIENRSLIFISGENVGNGIFVENRKNALEDTHSFSLERIGSNWFFQSDMYAGKLKKLELEEKGFKGVIALSNRKKRFFFFRQVVPVRLEKREVALAVPGERYIKTMFKKSEVSSDVVYGKAYGYWTDSPYSDDPYIETLAKGLIKTFDDHTLLDLKMDIYQPLADTLKHRPLVVLIHGGGFYIGSKQSVSERKLGIELSSRGYVVASINYRLGFKPLAKDIELSAYRAVQDAHAALRYLSNHAAKLRIDPEQIYVGGTSAGAVASLNVAFMDNDERPLQITEAEKNGALNRIESSGNKLTAPFRIKGVLNMWGAVADLNIIDADEKIPVLSIHGTADQVVPFGYDYPFQNSLLLNRALMSKMYGSKPIHDRLKILGIRNKLVPLEGLGHEPELRTFNTLNHYMDTITDRVVDFLKAETAPQIVLPEKQLTLNRVAVLKPFYYEITGGNIVQVSVTGGVKTSSDPADLSIIWFCNSTEKKFSVTMTNQFDAWSNQTYSIKSE